MEIGKHSLTFVSTHRQRGATFARISLRKRHNRTYMHTYIRIRGHSVISCSLIYGCIINVNIFTLLRRGPLIMKLKGCSGIGGVKRNVDGNYNVHP